MARFIMLSTIVLGVLLMPILSVAGDKPSKGRGTVKEVKAMSEKDQMALALSAAPAHIAKDAGVMIYGANGILTETKPSGNAFTCIPTVMNLPEPDPMCVDAAANQVDRHYEQCPQAHEYGARNCLYGSRGITL